MFVVLLYYSPETERVFHFSTCVHQTIAQRFRSSAGWFQFQSVFIETIQVVQFNRYTAYNDTEAGKVL